MASKRLEVLHFRHEVLYTHTMWHVLFREGAVASMSINMYLLLLAESKIPSTYPK
jgi:hypothetical protein